MRNISIIIPTYNEKENIFKLTKKISNLYPRATIYIIDDTKGFNLKKNLEIIKLNIF